MNVCRDMIEVGVKSYQAREPIGHGPQEAGKPPMTHRERIQATLRFERPDRLPCHETPWDQTLAAWYEQGLPRGLTPTDYFGFDLEYLYLDLSPRFEQRVLKRENGMITYEDRFGYTVKKHEAISSTIHFLRHATESQEAWERIKPRFTLSADPDEPARIDDLSYFAHFAPYPSWDQAIAKCRRLRAQGRYQLLVCYGPWEATWRHRGFESLLMDTVTDPDWVEDMAATYMKLLFAVVERCLTEGIRADGLFLTEDLGARNGPLISPKSWARIFKPWLGKLGTFLRERRIDLWMHSDGYIMPLLDHLIECGVQVLNPLEVKAGMDAVQIRRRYGKRLTFFGNIDATVMGGPQEVLAAELRRKVPLARAGGYIMHSDHSCPPEVTFDQYCWMYQAARRIFDEDP